MRLIEYFNTLFPPAPSLPHRERRQQEFRRSLLKRYANGNVSAQSGRIVTSTDIAERRARFRHGAG